MGSWMVSPLIFSWGSEEGGLGSLVVHAPYHARLKVFGAHDSASAASARSPVVLVHDASERDQVLASSAYGHHRQVLLAMYLLQRLPGLVDALSPQAGGITQAQFSAFDIGIQ